GGGGCGGGRRVAGARPMIVGPSPPAERIAIRHGGVTVKDRDQGWLDASVRRRTAAALWSQVVLLLTGDVRVVCAADGHDGLRGPGRADGPRGTGQRTVARREHDRHVGVGQDEHFHHPGLQRVYVRGVALSVAVHANGSHRVVVLDTWWEE